ncbi:MAG: hypothetical protein ACK4RK_22115 [Gemmataceae bacterium]
MGSIPPPRSRQGTQILAGAGTNVVDHRLDIVTLPAGQAAIQLAQFTARLAPHALIDHLQHHEIGLVMLARLPPGQILARQVFQIGQHQPHHAAGPQHTPTFAQKPGHEIARHVFQKM